MILNFCLSLIIMKFCHADQGCLFHFIDTYIQCVDIFAIQNVFLKKFLHIEHHEGSDCSEQVLNQNRSKYTTGSSFNIVVKLCTPVNISQSGYIFVSQCLYTYLKVLATKGLLNIFTIIDYLPFLMYILESILIGIWSAVNQVRCS